MAETLSGMDQQTIDNEDDKPLDPAVEKVRRKLVRFMAINLGLLGLALMAVVLAIVYRWTRTPEAPQPPAVSASVPQGADLVQAVPLPAGTRVTGHALSQNRVSLDTVAPDGSRQLVIYDFAEGRVVARVALPAQ